MVDCPAWGEVRRPSSMKEWERLECKRRQVEEANFARSAANVRQRSAYARQIAQPHATARLGSPGPFGVRKLVSAFLVGDGFRPKCLKRFGALGAIRTPDPQIRSLMLYPAELRARAAFRRGAEPSRTKLKLQGAPSVAVLRAVQGAPARRWSASSRSRRGFSKSVRTAIPSTPNCSSGSPERV
jgi:hypothetical protein